MANETVIKGGTVYDAATLDERWPRQRPYGGYYWIQPDALKSDDKPVGVFDVKK